MDSLKITKQILKEQCLYAKKGYGQNFLVDDSILKKIVDSANVEEGDKVIEIGPGLGNLTHYILEKGAKVTAFEIDNDMMDILEKRFAGRNLEIVNKDILQVDLNEYMNSKIKIIANLPYYITTPIIFKLLEYRENIESITIMVQKEVADRIVAKPRSKDYGVLTINTLCVSNAQKLFDVPNTSFIPSPKVTSSIVKIIPDENKSMQIDNLETFKDLVKKAFSERRKKLINSLFNTGLCDMSKNEIEKMVKELNLKESCRAEEVSIEQFVEMANYISRRT